MSAYNNIEKYSIIIPEIANPVASYLPYTQSGNIVFISGQLPFFEGKLARTGHLGLDVSLEDGQRTAEICALNILGQLKNATNGDLNKVKKILKLEILVAASPDFADAHLVANGASQLMLKTFGDEVGLHARVAYSVAALPLNAAVEVAATVEVV